MVKYLHIVFFLFISLDNIYCQKIYEPNKISDSQILLDGIIGKDEWKNSERVELVYEIEPAYNTKAKLKTIGYLSYSEKYLYVGIYAFGDPEKVRSAVRSRDDYGMWNDDVVLIRFDTYTDARNNILLAVNPRGSQFDVKGIDALTDEERYDASYNVNFESFASLVNDGYNVEMKIPFSSLPFPGGKNQKWHFNLFRKYFDENSNEIGISSQKRDRDNPCEVCQVNDILIMNYIFIDKKIELLPFITSNLVGDFSANSNKLEYSKPSAEIGIGLNLDLTKNTSIEISLNPDFSQVESDVTQIDINSAYALLYPEKRPFFKENSLRVYKK